jgi:predicted negative regulator of RcsB-dependent stress response
VADELPKDRNARVREDAVRRGLLKKRNEQAQKSIPLAPGEMVDDALARGTEASLKWLRSHLNVLQYVILGAVGAAVAWYFYDSHQSKRAETASAELAKAVLDERGRIGEAPKAEDGMPDVDPTPWFKTAAEKREAVAKAYGQVAGEFASTGPGMLAKLGEANAHLDAREWDKAEAAFRATRESSLAKVDADVRGRAIEGLGYALEGKGDTEGALKAFQDLAATDVRGFKELGQYHQARLLFAKGDAAKAKEILKPLSDKLHAPSDQKPLQNLANDVDDLLRRIDPSAAPQKPGPSLGRSASPEDMARIQELIQRKMREAQEKKGSP